MLLTFIIIIIIATTVIKLFFKINNIYLIK